MKKISFLVIVFLQVNLISACATKVPVSTGARSYLMGFKPASSVDSVRNYAYDYNQIAGSTAYNEVYVICQDCQPTTKLERELEEVQIALFWGREKVVSTTTSSQSAQQKATLYPTSIPAEKRAVQTEPSESSKETAKIDNSDTKMKSSAISINKTFESGVSSCLTSPIQFDFDSAVLSDSEKTKIMASLDYLKEAKHIAVKGFTCDAGSKEYNDGLALRRAEAVAGYLEELGIKPSEVIGEGKCCYVSQEGSKNRRAEIYCQKMKGE